MQEKRRLVVERKKTAPAFHFHLYVTNLKQFFPGIKSSKKHEFQKSVIANNKLPDIAGGEVLCK